MLTRHRRAHLLRRPWGHATLFAGLILSAMGSPATADDTRVQTAAVDFHGEPLVGMGLVIGLPGTGDSAIDAAFIKTSIVGILQRAGLDPWQGEIVPGRIAIVMLSAELPRGARDRSAIEVSVSAVGDARSLAGGTLLAAPLRDAAGAVQAVGQGTIAAGVGRREGRLADTAMIQHQNAAKTYAALQ